MKKYYVFATVNGVGVISKTYHKVGDDTDIASVDIFTDREFENLETAVKNSKAVSIKITEIGQ